MKHELQALTAPVTEVFFSYQGEGVYVGQPQIFVRFSGCNLSCAYCDTAGSAKRTAPARDCSPRDVVDRICALVERNQKSFPAREPMTISLTGGEPLLHAGFLSVLLAELKSGGFQTYLETNATLPAAFAPVRDLVDVAAADIKLPSSCGKPFWKEHRAFLKLAGERAFIKVVVTEQTTTSEIRRAIAIAETAAPAAPFVIQPATPSLRCKTARPEKVYEWLSMAGSRLSDVRLVPQMHKFWRIR